MPGTPLWSNTMISLDEFLWLCDEHGCEKNQVRNYQMVFYFPIGWAKRSTTKYIILHRYFTRKKYQEETPRLHNVFFLNVLYLRNIVLFEYSSLTTSQLRPPRAATLFHGRRNLAEPAGHSTVVKFQQKGVWWEYC